MIEPDGTVPSLADAWRVTRYARCFVAVLVRADSRVKKAYATWQARMIAAEEEAQRAGADVDAIINREIWNDFLQMRALVHELDLECYKSWLPRALAFEFSRRLGVDVDDFLPPSIDKSDWAEGERSRNPKNGEKQEDPLVRDVIWFYRAKVKRPRDTAYKLGKEHSTKGGLGHPGKRSQNSTPEKGILRVERGLRAINKSLPKD